LAGTSRFESESDLAFASCRRSFRNWKGASATAGIKSTEQPTIVSFQQLCAFLPSFPIYGVGRTAMVRVLVINVKAYEKLLTICLKSIATCD
jgi:hypothetical protein